MEKIVLPLKQSVGTKADPIVSEGDVVKRGQLIAQPSGLGVNLHASLDGTISEITDDTITIIPNLEQSGDYVRIPDTEDNLEAIKGAGID